MEHQKDNDKNLNNKGISPIGHDVHPSNYYRAPQHRTYVSLAERSSKVVTALYMVTDFLADRDPMRDLIRRTATDSMEDLFALTHLARDQRAELLAEVNNRLYALGSYLTVIFQNGAVSDMNYQVIQSEIEKLRGLIEREHKRSLPYDQGREQNAVIENFTFADNFFGRNQTQGDFQKDTNVEQASVKDTKVSKEILIKTSHNRNVLNKQTALPSAAQVDNKQGLKTAEKPKRQKQNRLPKLNEAKEERKENILKILKQKPDASIKDICLLFKDCSSKTIQRDLTELIDEGLVKKEGSRRWSTYNLSY
ncbi:DeoR family transcriptional regulator [Patescibacteria group bacterium]|nr:DeoR family transcriptional regulator [Patescibacteria group bacterium]